MKIDWSPLESELRLWRSQALSLPIWWRDDDAISRTDALDQLASLAAQTQMPIHIAVIPDHITPSLRPLLAQHPLLVPVVHGWRHVSHAPDGQKNAEFGHTRPDGGPELKRAMDEMDRHFGADLIKMFVPPWNRISDDLVSKLSTLGYSSLSTYGPRKQVFAAPKLIQINTHIDPIFWRGDRGLCDPELLISGITTTLKDRREGRTDATEPLGLLTHHLVHTADIWSFSADLMLVLLEGGAVPADIRALAQPSLSPNI
ncbi:MAG: polysaccharide deacetylase family protein [Sulfitobacter sp.]